MVAPTTLPRGITRQRGRYRVRIDNEGRTYHLGNFDTLTDARAALDIARGEVARGLFVSPAERRAARKAEVARAEKEAMTLRQWSEIWLASLEADPHRSGATVVSYRSVLKNHVLPELGDIRLVELTTERVAEHLADLARRPSRRHPGARVNGVAPNTVIALRSMLNAAVKAKAGGLESFQFPAAPKHRRVRPEDEHGDVGSPKEIKALTAAMPAHLRIAVPLAAWCALRIGEAPRAAAPGPGAPGRSQAGGAPCPAAVQCQGQRDHPAQGGQRQEHRDPEVAASIHSRTPGHLHQARADRAVPRGPAGWQGLTECARQSMEGCSRPGREARVPLPQSAAHRTEQVRGARSHARGAAPPRRSYRCHRRSQVPARHRRARQGTDATPQQGHRGLAAQDSMRCTDKSAPAVQHGFMMCL